MFFKKRYRPVFTSLKKHFNFLSILRKKENVKELLRKSYLFNLKGLLLGQTLLISWSILIIAFFTKSAADPCTFVLTACLSAAARLKYEKL